jgi:hypothetical protein
MQPTACPELAEGGQAVGRKLTSRPAAAGRKTRQLAELSSRHRRTMNKKEEGDPIMFTFLLWCILFVLCWPLALLALLAYPFIWLLLLPFRILGLAVYGVLEIVYLAITLPFRLLAAPFRI